MTPDLRTAATVWGRIGILSFGGPAGQIALMHHEIVGRRAWLSERHFLDALAFCQVIPGPEAQQLATYIGWRMHGLRGGLVAGGLFILPGAIFMMVLAGLYVAGAETEVVRTIFQVVRPLVVVIVALALVRLGRRALRGWLDLSLAAAAFVSLFIFHIPFPLVVLGAALIGAAKSTGASAVEAREQPAPGPSLQILGAGVLLWWLPPLVLLLLLGGGNALVQLGLFLGRVALVTFGGAYAILSYVQVQAVERFHWLKPVEMLDGLGLAETTPGPLILVLQFVGFLTGHRFGAPFDPWIGGVIGALIALWASFVPSFTFVLAGAPYMEWVRGVPRLQGAMAAVSAAVVGVVLNLAVTFASQAIAMGR